MNPLSQMEPEQKPRSPLVIGLVLSFVLHLLVMIYKISMRSEVPPLTKDQGPIEISQIPESVLKQLSKKKTQEPQMAETEDAQNKEVPPDARFFSDRNQTVKQQLRAKSVDDFRKKQGTGLKTPPVEGPQGATPNGEQGNEAPSSPNDLGIGESAEGKSKKSAGIKRDWKTLSLKDLSVNGDGAPMASTDDKLDGVQDGERTILSTREFRYFSYYHRIKELLRQYWKPNVEAKLYRMWEKGKPVGEEEMITKVLVLLDENGQISKISKLSSSGVTELDEAAIEAFEKAAPFPNPPKGIIESDGFVRIRWDFILKTEAAPRIQFQTAGQAGPRY